MQLCLGATVISLDGTKVVVQPIARSIVLDTVELIMAIEEEFDTEIPEEEAATIATVKDALDFVSKL